VLCGFIDLLATLQSGIGDARCAAEVEHPPSPVLQKVVLGSTRRTEGNGLKSREVAAENGLSATARHEAAATDPWNTQMEKAESAQHVGSNLDMM